MRGHHYADCSRCDWQSLVVCAQEADELGWAHDDLHHAGHPTAQVAYTAGTTA